MMTYTVACFVDDGLWFDVVEEVNASEALKRARSNYWGEDVDLAVVALGDLRSKMLAGTFLMDKPFDYPNEVLDAA